MPTARRLMIKSINECACEKQEANAGWWTVPGAVCHGAWAAKGAADFPTSFIDLSGSPKSSVIKFPPTGISYGPGVDIVKNPTWDVTDGWMFTRNQGLDSTVPYCLHNTIIFRFSNALASAGIFGTSFASTGITRCDIIPSNYGHTEFVYAGIRKRVSPQMVAGIIGFAGNRVIRNKEIISENPIQPSVTVGNIHLGRYNLRAGIDIQALAVYCTKLTQAETDALGDRMLAI